MRPAERTSRSASAITATAMIPGRSAASARSRKVARSSCAASPSERPTISAASPTPIVAPAVSIARWKPNARPRRSGAVESAISASRGAVRIPFPIRSPTRAARTSGQVVATRKSDLARTEVP